MKIIDAHTHIFPDKIAEKATLSISGFYNIEMDNIGFSDKLIESGEKLSVAKYLVCAVATKPTQVVTINNFIIEQCKLHDCFLGFATLHPDYEDIEGEILRIKKAGLRGIKLHADMQFFNTDDEKAFPIYEIAEREGLPVLFHAGDERYDYTHPRRIANVANTFKRLTCIAAHFGGFSQWQEVDEHLKLDNVYFDTSSSLFAIDYDKARALIRLFGADKFMFGTDFPMWDHLGEWDRFMKLGLTQDEVEQICYKTFESLFGEVELRATDSKEVVSKVETVCSPDNHIAKVLQNANDNKVAVNPTFEPTSYPKKQPSKKKKKSSSSMSKH